MGHDRVLLVDDEEEILVNLGYVLEAAGFLVSKAKNGLEALDVLEKEQIDILVTDINMPEMDGIELIQKVSVSEPLLPVIIVTGHEGKVDTVKALQLGAYHYLRKPIKVDELISDIHIALEVSRTKRESMMMHIQQREMLQLFRSTAHTMRNAFGSISGLAQMVDRYSGDAGKLQALSESNLPSGIIQQVDELEHLLQVTLTNSHSDALNIETLDLISSVKDMLDTFFLGKYSWIQYDLDLADEVIERGVKISSSKIAIYTILSNIFRNATDEIMAFVRQSGNEHMMDEKMLTVAIVLESDNVSILATNRGRKIEPESREQIFTREFTDKQHGSGLGLFDVREILNTLGGTIQVVDPEEGIEGACFKVTLPLL